MERFAKPAVGALIEKKIDGEKFILNYCNKQIPI